MYLTRSEYDRGVNTFSPEGRLFQVGYFFCVAFVPVYIFGGCFPFSGAIMDRLHLLIDISSPNVCFST